MFSKPLMAAVIISACTLAGSQVFSQEDNAPAADRSAKPGEKQYFTVFDPTLIELHAYEYRNKDIQLADRFGEQIAPENFNDLLRRDDRRSLRETGLSPQTHYVFLTHPTMGSNMLCFAPRDSEEVQAFFERPLVPQTRIYMMGRTRSRIFTEKGVATLFLVDRIGVGTTPPKTAPDTRKKPIFFTIEYDVETADGIVRRKMEYKIKISEPGKTYEISDPYDPNRKLYMTFEF